jgi:predicted O-methyltransferase YrrM
MLPAKVWGMVNCLVTRPTEFVDRVACVLDRATDRLEEPVTRPVHSDEVWAFLGKELRADVQSIRREPALAETDHILRTGSELIPDGATFAQTNSAEPLLGHVAYVICRALRPTTVVETGVAYGSSSTYLLAALHENHRGYLHSIDLPSILDPKARLVGTLVPDALRDRWHLHLGASRRVLPRVLETVGEVDMFLHDSLHTKRNMRWEFETVARSLQRHGVIVSDDVNMNRAFEAWAQGEASSWIQVQQITRSGALGVAFRRER